MMMNACLNETNGSALRTYDHVPTRSELIEEANTPNDKTTQSMQSLIID